MCCEHTLFFIVESSLKIFCFLRLPLHLLIAILLVIMKGVNNVCDDIILENRTKNEEKKKIIYARSILSQVRVENIPNQE